jgi:hypothetical protein
LDEGKRKIVFVKTEAMWADGASKPFPQPGKYIELMQAFCWGKPTTSQPVGVAILI